MHGISQKTDNPGSLFYPVINTFSRNVSLWQYILISKYKITCTEIEDFIRIAYLLFTQM